MDFNWAAEWRDTVISHEEYMAEPDPSPFSVIDGWRKQMTLRDYAHHDHMGFGRDLGAGLLKSLHKRSELAPNTEPLDVQLRHVMKSLNAERKARGSNKLNQALTPANCGMDNM